MDDRDFEQKVALLDTDDVDWVNEQLRVIESSLNALPSVPLLHFCFNKGELTHARRELLKRASEDRRFKLTESPTEEDSLMCVRRK